MLTNQVFWEDVEVGSELPVMQKIATSVTAVRWAGALGAFNPLMYEEAFARSQGMEGPVLPGQLKLAWLVHLVTRWMGRDGRLKKISCEYRGIDYPRSTWTARSTVSSWTSG
jgi:acyl dehydratase